MKENEYHTLEDLLNTKSFRQWIMNEPGDHAIFWEDWLTKNPDKQDLVEEARLILAGPPFAFKDQPVNITMIHGEWEKLRKRTTTNRDLTPISTPRPKDRSRRMASWGWRAAASIALLAVMGFLLQTYLLNPLVVHQTPYGKQLSVILPDSSAVELNANSRLTYRRQNPRRVWLDGEAFFRVKKKPGTKGNFLVITNDLTVEVLGTSFNVLEKEEKTEVVLEEGSIKLNLNRDAEEELYMEPGEMVTFSARSNHSLEKRQVKTQSLTSWKDGVLEFEDVLLSEVMVRIESIYGWRAVYYNEELKTRKVTIDLLPSDDMDIALAMLGKAMGIEIEQVRENKVLLLH